MTFSQGLDSWNIQLWAERLSGNDGYTMPQQFLVNPYTAFIKRGH
jgi:P pilus assembly chaperone PapD